MHLQKVLMKIDSDYISNVTWPPGAEGRVQLLSNFAELVYGAAELFGEEAVNAREEPLVSVALRLCKDKVFGKGAADLLKKLPVEEGLDEVGTAPFGKAMTALRDFANAESAHRVKLSTVEQIFAGANGKGWTPALGTKSKKGEDAKSSGKSNHKDKDAPLSGGVDPLTIKCFNCGEFGHKKVDCPQKEKEQQPSWAEKAAGAAGAGAAGFGLTGSGAAGSNAAAGAGPSASHGQGKSKSDDVRLIINEKDGSATIKGTCRHCKMVDKHPSNFCPTAALRADCKWRGGVHRNTCSSYIKPQQH